MDKTFNNFVSDFLSSLPNYDMVKLLSDVYYSSNIFSLNIFDEDYSDDEIEVDIEPETVLI